MAAPIVCWVEGVLKEVVQVWDDGSRSSDGVIGFELVTGLGGAWDELGLRSGLRTTRQ